MIDPVPKKIVENLLAGLKDCGPARRTGRPGAGDEGLVSRHPTAPDA
jgi:hypothetical protein